MLRINVGLSRKLSRDYNSTGFSVNIDGEVTAPLSDAEAVIEGIKQFFDLAEEALDQEISRYQGDSAIASRDEAPQNQRTYGHSSNSRQNGEDKVRGNGHQNGNSNGQHSQRQGEVESATNKQVQYLLNIAKRSRLTTPQLEKRIEEILGGPTGIYDLTKRDAAKVIDALTGNGQPAEGRR